jgi:ABC-type sugar transport system ATPase subunit
MVTMPVLSTTDLSKRYVAETFALNGFDIDLLGGSIHGLVGVNGAGKSTVIKLLSGVVQPTRGRIRLSGHEVAFASPRDASNAGVGVVHQELPLLPNLTAADNAGLGLEHGRLFGSPDRSASRRSYEEAASPFREAPPADALMSECSLFQWQIVAIVRAVAAEAKILILDEPTSSLAAREREALHVALRDGASRGTAVLYVSHFLDDVLDVCDTVTVLRDGRSVLTASSAELDEGKVLAAMLGTAMSREASRPESLDDFRSGPAALTVADLSGDSFGPLTFTATTGECLGLYGLQGCGAEEVLMSIFGLLPSDGSITLHGQNVGGTTASRVRAGLAFVSGDRKRTLIRDWSVAKNHSLPGMTRQHVLSAIRGRSELSDTNATIAALGVVGAPRDLMSSLSGGNQQKVALGRWLAQPASVLLLNEPTLGVDVAGRVRIHSAIRAATEASRTFVLYSTDPEEVQAICDRVLILVGGQIRAELRGAEIDVEQLESLTRSGARHAV